ncbi:hypothetical protein [Fimbriiglobus ruber]|uniref:hypothetical protein n=1 Tax=Fimbriiglobus ruber TaxID=1908690 RepID=UPI000B4AFBD0|nr:hypothetical protein [Fimbriiglobus ruber]
MSPLASPLTSSNAYTSPYRSVPVSDRVKYPASASAVSVLVYPYDPLPARPLVAPVSVRTYVPVADVVVCDVPTSSFPVPVAVTLSDPVTVSPYATPPVVCPTSVSV